MARECQPGSGLARGRAEREGRVRDRILRCARMRLLDSRDADTRQRPSEIARRKPTVGETMQRFVDC